MKKTPRLSLILTMKHTMPTLTLPAGAMDTQCCCGAMLDFTTMDSCELAM